MIYLAVIFVVVMAVNVFVNQSTQPQELSLNEFNAKLAAGDPGDEKLRVLAVFSLPSGENPYDAKLAQAVGELESVSDFIIIDCPGSHTRLSQVAHSLADTLITPLNDSFIDFDLLARTDPETGKVLGPSIYSEMVWNARQLRARAGLKQTTGRAGGMRKAPKRGR